MRDQIVSEFRKITTTRSAYWLLGVLIGTAVLIAAGGVLGEEYAKDLTHPLQDQPFLLLPLTTATVFTMMLGIFSFTDEFRHGSIVPTLLVTPDRRRVLAAKLVVVGTASMVFVGAAIVSALAFGVPWLMAHGHDVTWSAGPLAEVCGRAIVAGMLYSAIGVGVGLALRRQLAAIVGVTLWTMAVETAIGALLPAVGKYLPDAAGTAIVGFDASAVLVPVAAIAVFAVWTVVIVAIGARLMERRDVT
jgi:ABC-2 type transport system permease protein